MSRYNSVLGFESLRCAKRACLVMGEANAPILVVCKRRMPCAVQTKSMPGPLLPTAAGRALQPAGAPFLLLSQQCHVARERFESRRRSQDASEVAMVAPSLTASRDTGVEHKECSRAPLRNSLAAHPSYAPPASRITGHKQRTTNLCQRPR